MNAAQDPARVRINELVTEVLLDPAKALAADPSTFCETCFLAGSFARNTFDPVLPNVNLYFIASPGRGPDLRLALSRFYVDARVRMRQHGFDIALDCHPYTIATRTLESPFLPQIVVTSKVLENNPAFSRLSLPPTIGGGWLAAHRVLHGRPDALEGLRVPVRTDLSWFQGLHEALTRYKNLLDHLPWAMPWQADPRLLFEESLRYAEEASRDALPVALTQDELTAGLQFALYHKWDGGTEEFLCERYGESGTWMNGTVRRLKARFASGGVFTMEESEEAWRAALAVWEVVWLKFCERARTERPIESDWLTRVNAFV